MGTVLFSKKNWKREPSPFASKKEPSPSAGGIMNREILRDYKNKDDKWNKIYLYM